MVRSLTLYVTSSRDKRAASGLDSSSTGLLIHPFVIARQEYPQEENISAAGAA